MHRNEAQTQYALIDPAILLHGWACDHVKAEQLTSGIIINDKGMAVRRKGRTDYLLRMIIKNTQPIAKRFRKQSRMVMYANSR